MANISISLEGIDKAIENLNYRAGSVKYRAIRAIRSFYTSEASIKELNLTDTDLIIPMVWNVGDNPVRIKSKRRNFSSIKSSINADLQKLSQKGLNDENIIITDSNLFDMSDEAKNNLLNSFTDAVKTGDIDLEQATVLLKTVTDFLENVQLDDIEADPKNIIEQIKKILSKITEDVDSQEDPDETPGLRRLKTVEELTSEEQTLEDVFYDPDDDVEEMELDEDEELEEIEEDELLEDDIEEIELDEDEELEEVEADELLDDDVEEIELDEDEELEEIDEDEIEETEDDIEEIELDEDEELEEIEEDELLDDDIEEIELDEDEELEEVEADELLDDDAEEIELDEDEELMEIDDDGIIDEDIEELELDDEDIEEIDELDEEPDVGEALEEVELDEDDLFEELEDVDEDFIDDDVEEIELDEDEELEEIDELDEEELKALEEFREKRKLAQEFDTTLGEREKKFNQYTIVPAGLYTIGTKKKLKACLDLQQFEMPKVFIGVYPVTNSLFEIFIESTGYVTTAEKKGYGCVYTSRFKQGDQHAAWSKNSSSRDLAGACWFQPAGPGSNLHGKRNHPVVQVSVEDAIAFASWIGRRIPTEAEWESAARTDMGYKYPWGNICNFQAFNIEQSGICDTSDVDRYDSFANEFSIVDMLGNVMEWTSETQYPPFKSNLKIKYSVAKGAAWNGNREATISSRALFKPGFTSNTIGFRCISEMFQ